jgi:glycosyltransferase involved in cell wall biosynthesis
MNISICITVFNEEGTVAPLLDSLVKQSLKPKEIVIVDGGSKDKTLEIIGHFQKKFRWIKLLKENCNRAKGRNLGVEVAKGEIIAITDAGCTADSDWLKNITAPFVHAEVDVSAGFYTMTGKKPMNKAMGIYLGVTPRNFGHNFLPSTRSMAFRKSAWEAVGGFPEGKNNSAEDTDFNYKAVKLGLKYARVKSATVEWGMSETLRDFFNKIQAYAKWDVKYGIWWHPTQRLASHNIKVISVFLRYFLGLLLLVLSIKYIFLFPLFLLGFLLYLFWAYRKVFIEFGEWKIAVWGPVLQITSDFAVMSGFISGMF